MEAIARNYVGELNNYCQAERLPPPIYQQFFNSSDGTWSVVLQLKNHDGHPITCQAYGRNVKSAKQDAAHQLLLEFPQLPQSIHPLSNPLKDRTLLVPQTPLQQVSVRTNCDCNSNDQLANILLFIDADNVPWEACKHYKCQTFIFVGKLTNFPPKRVLPQQLCSNATILRCNWHSSDAVDVLLAMVLAQKGSQLGENCEKPICWIISGDQIFQSVTSSAHYLNINAQWTKQVPDELAQ